MSEDLITAISGDMLPSYLSYHSCKVSCNRRLDDGLRPLWNILCEGSTSLTADPFGHMECLYPSTPNICYEKNILRYIISKIKQIGHIEILMHLLPKFS